MNAFRRGLVFLVLGGCAFVLSQGILVMVLSRSDPPNEGNPVSRLILAVSYLCVGMTLIPYSRETLFVLRRNWFLLALLVLVFTSCLWTETPAFVLQRSTAVLGTTLLGIALAVRLSLAEQLRLMSRLFRIMSVLSLACVVFLPMYGISHSAESQGDWQGIFGYKNFLGSLMAVSILVEWHLPADTRYSKCIKWLAVLISAVLLVFSNAVTPLMALVGTLLLIEIYKFSHHRLRIPLYAIVLAAVLIIASGVAVLIVDARSVTDVLGRSSNLSGRTTIWSLVLSFISERPALGYGYSGFWYGASSESFAVDQAMGMRIMYAHNGYLEILLGLGAVGFLLMLGFLGTGMKRAYYYSEEIRSGMTMWPLAFLLFVIFYNLGEGTILLQDLQWALCVSVVASSDAALLLLGMDQEEEDLPYAQIIETT